MTKVLKVGGNQLEDEAFVAGLVVAVKGMVAAGDTPVIVHGGGKAIQVLQEKFSLTPRKIGGLRVTDEQTMALVMMALVGDVNIRLVGALHLGGVEAQGFNGADRGLLRSRKLEHPEGDLGRVGEIKSVQAEILRAALDAGVVPVVAPVALADDGGFHNVNADQAAGAIAAALGARQAVFVTNVPGVLIGDQPVSEMTRLQAQELVHTGVARDGMAVKINAAIDALSAGVGRAVITDLAGLTHGTGTEIVE
jgi:acetylglutamate kinase